MIRYLVRESLASQGVQAAADVANPREIPAETRHELSNGVVVLCLSGPPEVWRKTISETRRTMPGGRVVAVTFGGGSAPKDVPAPATDARLGADGLVQAPANPETLREAVLKARYVRSPSNPETSGRS